MYSAAYRRGRCIGSTADGTWLGDWEFPVPAPHGLWISPDDRVFITDTDEHVVRIFDRDGNVLQTIGTPGQKGAPGEPFNLPTRAVEGPSGDIYVSDGYGQNWVHRFRADGELITSWGGDGTEPGRFQTPHGIWVDADERVYVVDRANARVQVFDNTGTVLAIWEGFCFPHDIYPDGQRHLHRDRLRHPRRRFATVSRADAGQPPDRTDRRWRTDRCHRCQRYGRGRVPGLPAFALDLTCRRCLCDRGDHVQPLAEVRRNVRRGR